MASTKYAGIYEDKEKNTFFVKTQAKTIDGVKVYITKRGFTKKSEALTYKLNEVERVKNSYFIDEENGKMLFYDYIESYLASYKIDHELSTFKEAQGIMKNYVYSNFPNVPLMSLRPVMFKAFRENISKLEMCSKTKNKRIKHVVSLIQTANDKMLIDNTLYKQIMLELKTLPNDQHEVNNGFWEKEEYERFIATFEKEDKYYYLFRTLFSTGCRISELRALKWSDLNASTNSIRVDKQTTSKLGLGKWIIVPHTKTKEIRTIKISQALTNELLFFKSMSGMNDNCFMFYGHDPISENAVSVQKKSIVKWQMYRI